MDTYPDIKAVAKIKKKYPQGTRVELVYMDDARPIPPGTRGTVAHVDDIGTLHVVWDNGRMLGLIQGKDKFKII